MVGPRIRIKREEASPDLGPNGARDGMLRVTLSPMLHKFDRNRQYAGVIANAVRRLEINVNQGNAGRVGT